MMMAMVHAVESILDPPHARSRLMETEPLNMEPGTPWFLNQVVSGIYGGTPRQLLAECQEVEHRLGRPDVRPKNLSRTSDIDIIVFGNYQVDEQNLTIPHPALVHRRFCLEGLNDLCPDLVVPGIGKTANSLLTDAAFSVRDQIIRFID